MTTLAIVGAGIAGRSFIYALAKSKKYFTKIIIFDSDEFSQTCSRRSTAIVAPRGVSSGHSDLGDLIVAGLSTFQNHISNDGPQGIFKILQFTGTQTKLEMFKKRYPEGEELMDLGPISLKSKTYVAREEAFLIDPEVYLNWLKEESRDLPIEWRSEFVVGLNKIDRQKEITLQSGEKIIVDDVIVTSGTYTKFWQPKIIGKAIQGSYFEFKNVDYGQDSFSLTLDGDNIIYNSHSKKMLLGSTTLDSGHILPDKIELQRIFERLDSKLKIKLPSLECGVIITGLREKAPKRRPYLYRDNDIFWLGGLYKNGFSLSLHLGYELVKML